MSDHSWSPRSPSEALARFLGVPFDAQTYRNLAYLLLAFPLGIAYFTVVTTGLSTGLGLLVTFAGVPIVIATLLVTLGIGSFERRLADYLLDVDVDADAGEVELAFGSVEETIGTTKRVLTAPTTWTGLLLVGLKFVYGVVAFTALVTAFAVSATLLAAPALYDAPGVTYTFGPYVIDTLREAVAGAGLGVLLVLVSLHVSNGLARFGGFLTDALLGGAARSAEVTDA
ncbi:sensor protein [Halorubrum coriense DSM 10284]|uniref:Sensor protein n=1 Tax=Halorubrum coriense DSM 10284 TaxID=1227466 RepID=M0EHF8_9EURY|nr:sensor domain-containing protein [Halorubrum coriense]ELZ47211.1 sensor protein [Halorubrum coriense DSM 10284]